jgi:hypothetical protein
MQMPFLYSIVFKLCHIFDDCWSLLTVSALPFRVGPVDPSEPVGSKHQIFDPDTGGYSSPQADVMQRQQRIAVLRTVAKLLDLTPPISRAGKVRV